MEKLYNTMFSNIVYNKTFKYILGEEYKDR